MIPNQWYAILRSEDVRKDRPTGARRLGQELVIWRDTSGQLVCQSARCPHKGANLADGRLRGDTIGCPYHDFRFGTDGECKLAPCLGPQARIPKSMRIDTYPVREQNGLVWMWWGRHMEVLPEIQVPPEVADKPALYATATWSQPVHYTRYIESLLDFYHVPIVHRDHWFNYADYMGWGGTFKKLGLDGRRRYIAMTKVENSVLETDGTTIRHAFDLCEEGDPTNRNFLNVTFTFPGMVHIHTAPFDVTIWMTPIDDEHTQVMFRWYEDPHLQKVLRFKSLRLLIPRFALFAQKRVQEVQDMRVVTRVEPKISGRGVNKLVAVDELNAKYLVLRDKLKKDAEAEAEVGAAADPAAGRTPAANSSPENGSGHSKGSAPAKLQVTTPE
ncbi:aromatic ring-hydroxylating dioxygenase subunit alpha [Streptomyces sp. So13.3]|uniref:aromatic ring-hydroxylating oxygenase subunit alpha n=1 Tax=Streptomyces sp. So13.3 TaxID=2136173 RepID=UPI0011075CA1|nr:aromatic ring-hydroxylating dioxygenase subunit alpha [Streptomyces sp. So13.3]QNA71965.1 aromatic ring-hydroxylating dioxygenase subunit alpha [Streptomyces sp. So13.3]